MKKISSPQNEVFWYIDAQPTASLKETTQTDVVVVGGGMAGLTAAQHFHEKGCSVVLLEKNFCGAGASGKSSGFITPGSELSLSNLMHAYGPQGTKELWDFVSNGVDIIEKNINTHHIACDYKKEDTLFVANSNSTFKKYIVQEHEARLKLGYSSTLYSAEQLAHVIGSSSYYGGVTYGGTFGIKAYAYCQSMKNMLISRGVKIYEDSPVINVEKGVAYTTQAQVKARHIVVCLDQFLPTLKRLTYDVYHAQTFITMSAPLDAKSAALLFPQKQYMMWDTDLVYQYFRLTGENRLILGGSTALYTFAKHEIYDSAIVRNKLHRYFKKRFPDVSITFEYMWPGLIGISKDLVPIAGTDKDDASIYYITSATGLPWAAALGKYSADHIIDGKTHMDHYFSPYRPFPIGHAVQRLLGTRLTFALSNYIRTR